MLKMEFLNDEERLELFNRARIDIKWIGDYDTFRIGGPHPYDNFVFIIQSPEEVFSIVVHGGIHYILDAQSDHHALHVVKGAMEYLSHSYRQDFFNKLRKWE